MTETRTTLTALAMGHVQELGAELEDYDLAAIIRDLEASLARALSDGRMADVHDMHVAIGVLTILNRGNA